MARIFISMAGEGRGHAARIRTLVEALRDEHEMTLYCPGDAFAFLQPLYAGSEVRVKRIAGLRFHYTARRRVDYQTTGFHALGYLRRLPSLRAMLERDIAEARPDLVIADFEPALPRAARRMGVPFLSFDHQHFLLAYDLSSLPLYLRLHAAFMAWIVRGYFSGQRESIVSSFYFPPLKPAVRGVTQVGTLLRREILEAKPENHGHLLAYCRRFAGPAAMQALRECGRPVQVFGLGSRPPEANLSFHEIHEARFVASLATCAGLVATAGNQLLGEALHLGKPVFALPEARNFEQYINAHFLRASGSGDWKVFEQVTPGDLRRFVERLSGFRPYPDRHRLNGLPEALAVVRRHLPAPRPSAARPRTVAC